MLRDVEGFSNDFMRGRDLAPELKELDEQAPPSMLGTDPPVHTRLRSLVNKAFTPRIVRQLEPRLHEVAHALVDAALEQGEVDLVQALTYPLPVTAIAEIIGVPPADRERFKVWSDQAVATLGTGFFGAPDVEQLQRQLALREEMNRYFVPLAEERQREPKDDLLTGLVQAEHEGSRLDQDEMLAMLVLLLVAGNETTTTLIGNAVLDLAGPSRRAEAAARRSDPCSTPRSTRCCASPRPCSSTRAARPGPPGSRRPPSRRTTLRALLARLGEPRRAGVRAAGRLRRRGARRTRTSPSASARTTASDTNLARLEARVALEALLARTASIERPIGAAAAPSEPCLPRRHPAAPEARAALKRSGAVW